MEKSKYIWRSRTEYEAEHIKISAHFSNEKNAMEFKKEMQKTFRKQKRLLHERISFELIMYW